MTKIYLGSDHGGFLLKQGLYAFLSGKGYSIEDCGVFNEASAHYPDIAISVCKKVLKEAGSIGVLICGTGIGMSITANKIPGIRAALCHEPVSAKMSRAHNNANVLCLGGRMIGYLMAYSIVEFFLNTPFDEGRHSHRLSLIQELEKESKHES
ncbi:MAG: ribose 5-phosphate isomerase B [Caldisericia bacterium]|nr:ribose 5-phosphate isomerase B [Caldisericia bacterium]